MIAAQIRQRPGHDDSNRGASRHERNQKNNLTLAPRPPRRPASAQILTLLRHTLGMAQDERIAVLPLEDALAKAWGDDRHFCAYEARTVPVVDAPGERAPVRLLHCATPRRDGSTAPAVWDVLEVLDAPNVKMIALVGDIDGPDHVATDEWRAETEVALKTSGLAYYATRNGYRVIALLKDAFVLESSAHANQWAHFYLGWIEYLRRTFNLTLDPTCSDWTRIYRLPNVQRDASAESAPLLGRLRPWLESEWIEPTGKVAKRVRSMRPVEWLEGEIDSEMREALRELFPYVDALEPSISGLGGNLALIRARNEIVEWLGTFSSDPRCVSALLDRFNQRSVDGDGRAFPWDASIIRREAMRGASEAKPYAAFTSAQHVIEFAKRCPKLCVLQMRARETVQPNPQKAASVEDDLKAIRRAAKVRRQHSLIYNLYDIKGAHRNG